MTTNHRKTSRGFSLVEALIGLLILGFGLIAIAKFQSTLLESSDFAKQRTEATRLGQEKMEQMRTFEQIAVETGKLAYKGILEGDDTVSGTNGTFTREWEVTDSTGAAYKSLVMKVTWKNRKNEDRSIELHSTIAEADPKASGSLIIAPQGSPVKQPRDRSLNIPVPAESIPGQTGKSAFSPPGSAGIFFVFNDATGIVTQSCSGIYTAYEQASCTDVTGYVVSGYVKFSYGGGSPSAENPGSSRLPLDVTMTLTDSAAVTPAHECFDDSTATLPRYANTVTYTCIVYPRDHDGDPETPRRWSGNSGLSLNLATIGTASTSYKVCRYSFDYNYDGVLSNQEHPGPNAAPVNTAKSPSGYSVPVAYTNVTESLENQNFLVIKGNSTCPSSTAVPTSGTVNYNTEQHQP